MLEVSSVFYRFPTDFLAWHCEQCNHVFEDSVLQELLNLEAVIDTVGESEEEHAGVHFMELLICNSFDHFLDVIHQSIIIKQLFQVL